MSLSLLYFVIVRFCLFKS